MDKLSKFWGTVQLISIETVGEKTVWQIMEKFR